MHRRRSGFARLAAVAGLVLAAACQDVPTGPAPVLVAGAPAGLNRGLHNGQVPVVCSLGAVRVNALGFDWLRKEDTLYVPRAELDPAGRTVEYKFSANNRDGVMAFGASCARVPYTENALRRLDKRFLVRENGGADQFKARQGAITIQGCVQTEKGCLLETVTVTAQPNEEQEVNPCDYDPQSCWGDFGGGDDGGGWTPEGPAGPECLPGDVDCDGTTEDEGPGAYAICMAKKLGYTGAAALIAAGFNAYLAYDARQDARTARWRWKMYNLTWDIPDSGWNEQQDRWLREAAEEAEEQEMQMYAAMLGTGGHALKLVLAAAVACIPAAVAPV